jgi:hypothetical protein
MVLSIKEPRRESPLFDGGEEMRGLPEPLLPTVPAKEDRLGLRSGIVG